MMRAVKFFALGLALAPWSQSQAIELSSDFSLALDVGLFSDYWSRGISQTQGDPAVQGSATLIHSSGLYGGVWSSNVDSDMGAKPVRKLITT